MKKIVTIILVFFCAVTVFAKGPEYGIYGKVIDRTSGEGISHADVLVKGTKLWTSTDEEGRYSFEKLSEGNYKLEVSCMGYLTTCVEVQVSKTSNVNVNVVLEEDREMLDGAVVSVDRASTIRKISPVLIQVLDDKILEAAHAVCLADGLTFQPGVRVEDNCQNCGFTQVRINGLDGHYSQVLINSRPVFSALAGVYGLEQLPTNMIDRIEVIRGSGSAFSGPSAIGGTINIITKEPEENSAELSNSLKSIGFSKAFDNNLTVNASLVSDNRKAGFNVYGQNRIREGYDRDGDGYTEMPTLNAQNFGLQSFLKLSPLSKLTFGYSGRHEFRRGGNKLHLPAHEANIAEQIEHTVNGLEGNYSTSSRNNKDIAHIFASFQHIGRKSFYGGIGEGTPESIAAALKAYGFTDDLTLVAGAHYSHKFDRFLFMPSTLSIGAEYNFDGLHDRTPGYNKDFKQDVHIATLFLQNEWKNSKWDLLLGGRLDRHSVIHRVIFSPRANLRFNATENLNFRLGYSGGFRAPQAFDEDLHVSIAGGERIVNTLAKDLKEERSNSISLSMDYYHDFGTVKMNLLTEGFFTHLKDVFATRQLDTHDPEGNIINERYNANSAVVYGINIEGRLSWKQYIELQAGMTAQKSYYLQPIEWNEKAPKETRMMRTPDIYGYFTINFNPYQTLNIALTGTYTGSMLVGHALDHPVAVNTPSFFTTDFKISYDFKILQRNVLQLNIGIQNITDSYQKDFDKGWERDSGYIYGPVAPRSIYAGIKLKF